MNADALPHGLKTPQLLVFRAVVMQGGFTRAAELLHVSQPAASMSVRQLETAFGAPLLERSRFGPVELTQLGREVYPLTEELAHLLEKLEALRRDAQADADQLVISCGVTSGVYLMTQHLADFQARGSPRGVAMHLEHVDRVVEDVTTGRADLGLLLAANMGRAAAGAFETLTLWKDELLPVAPSGNPPLRRSQPVDEWLKGQPFILPPGGQYATRGLIDEAFQRSIGHPPVCLMEVPNPEALKRLVLSSGTPGILLRSNIGDDLERRRLELLDVPGFPLPCHHVVFRLRHAAHSPQAVAFWRFLRRRCSAPGGDATPPPALVLTRASAY